MTTQTQLKISMPFLDYIAELQRTAKATMDTIPEVSAQVQQALIRPVTSVANQMVWLTTVSAVTKHIGMEMSFDKDCITFGTPDIHMKVEFALNGEPNYIIDSEADNLKIDTISNAIFSNEEVAKSLVAAVQASERGVPLTDYCILMSNYAAALVVSCHEVFGKIQFAD